MHKSDGTVTDAVLQRIDRPVIRFHAKRIGQRFTHVVLIFQIGRKTHLELAGIAHQDISFNGHKTRLPLPVRMEIIDAGNCGKKQQQTGQKTRAFHRKGYLLQS